MQGTQLERAIRQRKDIQADGLNMPGTRDELIKTINENNETIAYCMNNILKLKGIIYVDNPSGRKRKNDNDETTRVYYETIDVLKENNSLLSLFKYMNS